MMDILKDTNIMDTPYKHDYDIDNPIMVNKTINKKLLRYKAYKCRNCGKLVYLDDYHKLTKYPHIIKGCINTHNWVGRGILLGGLFGMIIAFYFSFILINIRYSGLCFVAFAILNIISYLTYRKYKQAEKTNIRFYKISILHKIINVIHKNKKFRNPEYNKALRYIKAQILKQIEEEKK